MRWRALGGRSKRAYVVSRGRGGISHHLPVSRSGQAGLTGRGER